MTPAASRFLAKIWPAVEHWVLDENHLTLHLKSDRASLKLLQRTRAVVCFSIDSLGEYESRIVLDAPGRVGVVIPCGAFDLDPSELRDLRLTYVI